MTYTRYETWNGRGVVGKQVTIPVPVAKDNASGIPVVYDLTGVSLTLSMNKPDGTDATASITQSAVSGEEHVALVSVTSANLDTAGLWVFEIFLDGEPVTPRYRFYVDSAL